MSTPGKYLIVWGWGCGEAETVSSPSPVCLSRTRTEKIDIYHIFGGGGGGGGGGVVGGDESIDVASLPCTVNRLLPGAPLCARASTREKENGSRCFFNSRCSRKFLARTLLRPLIG